MTHMDGSYQEKKEELLKDLAKYSSSVKWSNDNLVYIATWVWKEVSLAKDITPLFIRRYPEMFRDVA